MRRGRCASRQKALGKTCRLNAQLTVNPPVFWHRRRAERRVVEGVSGAPPMAKKANEDVPEDDAEGAPPAEAAQGGKKKLILFGAVGLVATLYIGIAAGDTGFANPYQVLAAGAAATVAWVAYRCRSVVRKTRATLENLVDAIASVVKD